ncbi:hypothetical protein [Oceanobacillus kimchii]|uniref:hypothetical protein n=1 Tax=Oceanobacillus kimchii TaxID=746691 RepID=UPI003B01FD12
MIKLKLIKEIIKDNEEWGEGPGEIIEEIYRCPCGNGLVLYREEIVPDFFPMGKTHCGCKECKEKYSFDREKAIEQ